MQLRSGKSDRGRALEILRSPQEASASASASVVPYRSAGPVKEAFTTTHMLRALLASAGLKDTSALRANRVRQLQYMFPRVREQRLEHLVSAGFRDPSAQVLGRARLRFDVACMLAQRFWSVANRPFYRFFLCDASPQKRQSHAVFLSGEVLAPKWAVHGKAMSEIDSSQLFEGSFL